MSALDYKSISASTDMMRVVEAMGCNVNSSNKTLCPFHRDTSPSLHIYGSRYHCFACGASGDAIDYVKQVKGCGLKEAAAVVAEINGGAGLSLPLPPMQGAEKRRECDALYSKLQDMQALGENIRRIIATVEPFSPLWCGLYKLLDLVDCKCDFTDRQLLSVNISRLRKEYVKSCKQ